MVKGVIFDMDGTMFDTERLSTKGWIYAGKKLVERRSVSNIVPSISKITPFTIYFMTPYSHCNR